MSSQELQEIRDVMIGITDAIGHGFSKTGRQLNDVIEQLCKYNQDLLKQNKQASLLGTMDAIPTERFHRELKKDIDKSNVINEKIKTTQLALRQYQEKSPASPTDAKQAKALERQLNDLINQNAQLLKVHESLLKTTFVSGQAEVDKELSRQTLGQIQNQIGTGLTHNKVLHSELQAKKLASLGITMRTGTSAGERQPEQPDIKSGPKINK